MDLLYPDYKSTRLRAPRRERIQLPRASTELTGPALWDCARRAERPRPHAPARRRAARGADHRPRARARGRRPAGAGDARGGLAVQRRRPLPPPGRPAPRAAGPELHRARALPDRRRRLVRVRDGQARRLSVGQPPQRLAAGAHPLLRLRARVRAAAGDADVLPGRPAVRAGPDLQLGGRGPRPARRRLRPRPHASPSGRSPTAGTSSWPGPRSRMPEPTPPQTVGPFFSIGLPWDDGPQVVERGIGRRDRRCAAPSTTARARRCPTRSSRPGRRPATAAAASGAARPTPRAAGRSSPASPPPRAARRRTSPSPCSRAGCCDRVPTRIYFGDEAEANAADPLLSALEPERPCDAGRQPPRTAATASTSTSRGTVRPSSSGSETASAPAARCSATSTSTARRRARATSPRPFQEFISRYAWGDVWNRPGPRPPRAQHDHARGADRARRREASSSCTCAPRCATASRRRRSPRCCCTPPSTRGCRGGNAAFAVAQRVLEEE